MSFLKEVTQFWGNTTVIESDPGDTLCTSAIYAPFSSEIYFHDDPDWGIYDRGGQLIQAAGYFRGPGKKLIGQSQKTSLTAADCDSIDEDLIYGGPVIPHYGHFITATLPRLWHLRSFPNKRRRILCHGHEGPDLWFEVDYIRDMLWAIGLTEQDFVWLEQPAVIKRLWIPRPAMEEQSFIHRAFDDLTTKIGRFYGVHLQPRSDKAIYLSKTRLPSGITRFSDEHVLETHLAEHGVDIVHPHEMSFPDKLRLFASARLIAGTINSGFHTCLFLDRPSRILGLSGNDTVNANYILIDRLKENDATYLCPEIHATHEYEQDGFSETSKIDMETAADAFVEWI